MAVILILLLMFGKPVGNISRRKIPCKDPPEKKNEKNTLFDEENSLFPSFRGLTKKKNMV